MKFLKKFLNLEPPEEKQSTDNPTELLKEATKLKNKKEFDAADKLLLKALSIREQSGKPLGPDKYLRSVEYLYLSGKKDEAWKKLNQFVVSGFPISKQDLEAGQMDEESWAFEGFLRIYEMMGDLLEREKKFSNALECGILARYCRYILELSGCRRCYKNFSEIYRHSKDEYAHQKMKDFTQAIKDCPKEFFDDLKKLCKQYAALPSGSDGNKLDSKLTVVLADAVKTESKSLRTISTAIKSVVSSK